MKGRKIGVSRIWKREGKKAKTKIVRKISVFRSDVSNGIEVEVLL